MHLKSIKTEYKVLYNFYIHINSNHIFFTILNCAIPNFGNNRFNFRLNRLYHIPILNIKPVNLCIFNFSDRSIPSFINNLRFLLIIKFHRLHFLYSLCNQFFSFNSCLLLFLRNKIICSF